MYILIILLSYLLFNSVEAKTSSACYSSKLSTNCTIHQLSCERATVISLTSVTFGYRPGCSSVSDCTNLTCCVERTADCKIPVNQTHLLELKGGCDGRSACRVERLKDTSTACSAHSSTPAYSVIQYNCISTTVPVTGPVFATQLITRATVPLITTQATRPPVTTQATTQATTSTPIQSETSVASTSTESVCSPCAASTVGGILGTLLIICVILLILQFLYFQRKIKAMNKQNTVVEHQYDTTHRRQDSVPKPIYDALDSDGKPTYINLGNYARSDSTEYYNLKGVHNLPGAKGQNTKTTTLESQSGQMYETVDAK